MKEKKKKTACGFREEKRKEKKKTSKEADSNQMKPELDRG